VCSPARAAFLTGRHAFRTGVGNGLTHIDPGLSLAETTLPEILTHYDSACVGKWHLAGDLGAFHPNDSGFARYAGLLQGGVGDYFDWYKTVDGVTSPSTTYITTDITNEAVGALSSLCEPWFLYVAYNAPHDPLHVPPASLCQREGCATAHCAHVTPQSNDPALARAMVEAMDAEIGRLLAALDVVDPSAYVFFFADNGTAPIATLPPFAPQHGKGTVYEGGVNVPLLVTGPGVARGECAALVSVVDLFATIAELAGVHSTAEDSVSMVPCFADPARSLRASVYTETFAPNGGAPPYPTHRRAVRDVRYKLIRITSVGDEFYDLLADPFETTDLLPVLTADQRAAFDALEAELVALGVD
jgi:arylsulfatase A-like enzyme